MSSIPFDHECFNYVFGTESSGEFWFDWKDGVFGYWYTNFPGDSEQPAWMSWNVSLDFFEREYPTFIKNRVRDNYTFCGPVQPPPPPLIRKIREMEKRRQVTYA
jgi:hypothetical protein